MGKGKTEPERTSGLGRQLTAALSGTRKNWDGSCNCHPTCETLPFFPSRFSPFPFFRLTLIRLTQSRRDRSRPQRALFGQHRQGTTVAKRLPSSLAANNPTAELATFPARSRDCQNEGISAARRRCATSGRIPRFCAGPFDRAATTYGILALDGTRRHEAGCFLAVTGEEEAEFANSALRGGERKLPRIGRPSPGTSTAVGAGSIHPRA